MQHRIFDYESSEQLLHDRQIAGLQLPFARETGILKTPLRLGQRQIENRLAAQPVEGFDALPDGSPSEKNMARYRAYAAGMSGMIWLESVSVCASGRSNPSQLWLRRENVDRFRCLADEIRTAANSWGRPYTVVQLTHSGRYSGQHSAAGPESAFHNPLIPKEHERILTDGELSSLEDDYLLAAQLAQEAGFDAVDVRACHGYLINELLAAREREGRYGGGFENRARFLLDVVEKIRAHTEIEVAVRLNVYDALAYPYGFGVSQKGAAIPDLEEPVRLAKLLFERGVRLFNITCGIGASSPQVIRPSDTGGEIYRTEHPLTGVDRMLRLTRQIKQAVPQAAVVASAFTWLREFGANVAAGGIEQGWFDFAGFGRQPVCYPDYARDILTGGGMKRERCCTTCNGCMAWIKKTGKAIRCVKAETGGRTKERDAK